MKIPSFVSLAVLSIFLFPSASFAQFVSRGPDLIDPSFLNPNSNNNRYQIDSTVHCPTTTLNASGFAGNGQEWGTSVPDSAAFSGRDNYGFVVGISIPVGGRLSEFCDEYATLRSKFEEKRVESILLNNATTIINTCINLYNAGVDFADKVFNDGERLALLAPCRDLEPLISKMNDIEPERNKEEVGPSSEGAESRPRRTGCATGATTPTTPTTPRNPQRNHRTI
jgi:hypothetical protein